MKKLSILTLLTLVLVSPQILAGIRKPGPASDDNIEFYINNHYYNYGPKTIKCELTQPTGNNYTLVKKRGDAAYSKDAELVAIEKWKFPTEKGLIGATLICREDSPAQTRVFTLNFSVEKSFNSPDGTLSIETSNLKPGDSHAKIALKQEVVKESKYKSGVKFYITVKKT